MTKQRLVALAALSVGLWSASAPAQVTPRGKPVIRTPNTPAQPSRPAGAPTANPNAPGAPQPTPAPGQPAGNPGAPGGTPAGAPAKDPKDPMSQLPQTAKEIEFRPKPGDYLVSFSLEDADLPDLVKAISQTTGKRFIYGSKLRSIKATVYSPEKVTAAEAYSAFLSILESNGMTVIPHGSFLKIIDSQDAAKQPAPVYGTAAPVPAEDRFVTRLYRLTNVDATEVAQILNTNFKSKDGNITTYAPGNLLIITDTGSNIRRMLRIVEELDVGSAGDQIWVQPVYNSSAADAAAKLNEILGGKAGAAGSKTGGTGPAGNVIADERTNSLIITATKGDYDKILELVKRVVDAPMVEGDNAIHVLPLQHSKCSELQTSLSQILGGGAARPSGGTGRTGAAAAPAAAGGAAGGEEVFEGAVKVGCDEATNSLLTTSSARDYAALRAVVDKLDQPRRQVFIEAVIMDLNVNRTTDTGLSYHGGAPLDFSGEQGFLYGGNNVGTSVAGLPPADKLGALAMGVRGPEIEGTDNLLAPGLSIPALGVVLHALTNDGNSNVLATPHILATDSVEATISVGQDVPLQTNASGGLGQLAQAAGGAAAAGALGQLGGLLGGSAPREEVGIKLSITPFVNDSDQVRMELKEEISEVGSAPQGTLGAVAINKRQAQTTLIVRDQQTVVIGGLMRDQETTAETKIPILGDIPVLGFLFRQQVTTKSKTNLLLILTPYVVRDQDDLRVIFERKMQERQEFLDRYFVFSEDMEWSPPRDFSRSNGLLEAIRQSMLEARERERLEEEARPRRPRNHDAVEPIALPSTAAGPAKGGTGTTAAATTVAPTAKPEATDPQRGRLRTPNPTPARPPGGQRVE